MFWVSYEYVIPGNNIILFVWSKSILIPCKKKSIVELDLLRREIDFLLWIF